MSHLMKPLSATALCLGLFFLAISGDDLTAAPNPKDVPKYTADLKSSPDAKAKATALTELARIGQVQKSLISEVYPDMVKALEDKDPTVRAAAARAVGMVDPDPKEVVPLLTKMAKEDKVEAVQMAAMQGLANMGPNAKNAAKDLRAILEKEGKDSKLGKTARNVLRSIMPKKQQ